MLGEHDEVESVTPGLAAVAEENFLYGFNEE